MVEVSWGFCLLGFDVDAQLGLWVGICEIYFCGLVSVDWILIVVVSLANFNEGVRYGRKYGH